MVAETSWISAVGPELALSLAVLVVLSLDVFILREQPLHLRWLLGTAFAGFGLGLACVLTWTGSPGQWFDGIWIRDDLVRLSKASLLLLAGLHLLMSVDSDFTPHVGEFIALQLLATLGMMIMISTGHLLMAFIGLELASVSLYAMAAWAKDRQSAVAGLNYFLIGSVSAAFLLFGVSLLYALGGSLSIQGLAQALEPHREAPLLRVAIIAVAAGLGFKIAAVPFHLWAPRVYGDAPASAAAWISSGSKLAALVLLARWMMDGFAGAEGSGLWRKLSPGWMPMLAAMAAGSMLLGNLAALTQSSVRRLLAWSAVAHAGYVLLAVLAGRGPGVAALIYYAVTYAAAVLGAFGVVAWVEQGTGGSTLRHFQGLYRRAPMLALAMTLFLLSLAGMPPLAGFFGKFYLFLALLQSSPGWWWLVLVALGASVVSLYYYLLVAKAMFVLEPEQTGKTEGWTLPVGVILLLALAVLALGLQPGWLLDPLWSALGGSPPAAH